VTGQKVIEQQNSDSSKKGVYQVDDAMKVSGPSRSAPADYLASLLNSSQLRFIGKDGRSGVNEGQNRQGHEVC
jgi:hypothetical protein